MNAPVHYSDWSEAPGVRIACTQKAVTPAWDRPALTETPEVYVSIGGLHYSYDRTKITCDKCRESLQ